MMDWRKHTDSFKGATTATTSALSLYQEAIVLMTVFVRSTLDWEVCQVLQWESINEYAARISGAYGYDNFCPELSNLFALSVTRV